MFNYKKLNGLCYDENNLIWYVKVKSYSLSADYDKKIFSIDKSRIYDDMETIYTNYDMLRILNLLNKGNMIDDALLNIELKSSLKSEKMMEKLLENNYIESAREVNIKKIVSRMNEGQLSNLLQKHGIRAFGKRKNLMKKCMNKIPEFAFDPSRFKVTGDGDKFLEDYSFINYYYFLDDFDLIEYYHHVQGKEDIIPAIIDFLDENIKVAYMEGNFGHLDACYSAKSSIYSYNKDYENSLKCELKRFILRLNPQFYSYINYYYEYLIFNPENIGCIEALMDELEINDIKELFDEAWDLLDLKKQYMSRETAFDYLEKSVNGGDYDDLSTEYQDNYLESADEIFDLSLDYYNNHDYLVSSEFFENSMEHDSQNSEAVYYESLSYCHFKDWKWAKIRIDEALDLNPDDGRYWSVNGIISYESNNIDDAKKHFGKALELNPEDSDILTRIGVCYAHSNKTDTAIEYFNKAIEASKNNARPLLNKAKIYAGLKDWDNAEKSFDEAYNILGDNFEFFIEKGCYHMLKNQFDDAIESFENALKIKPNVMPVAVLKYLACTELGHNDEYSMFKENLSTLDLLYAKGLEKYLKK